MELLSAQDKLKALDQNKKASDQANHKIREVEIIKI